MPTFPKFTQRFVNLKFKPDNDLSIPLGFVFFIVGLIGILHHEMWRDELQAWLIAKDSSSIGELFKNLRYEGHPGLWHSCLYLITRFTQAPVAMQIFHLLLATVIVYIFTKFSPFTRCQKILFAFGYFPLYEYGIISRNYNLGILLIFVFCALYSRRKQGYLLFSGLIFLLANTNVYGCLLAIALAMTLLVDDLIEGNIVKRFQTQKWNLILSGILASLGILISLLQIVPPAEANYVGDRVNLAQPLSVSFNFRFARTLAILWRAYIPIPNFFHHRFWGSNLIDIPNGWFFEFRYLIIILSFGLIFWSGMLLARKPIALFLYLSATGGILIFSYLKFMGQLRHHGHLFIVLLVAVWIASFYKNSDWFSQKIARIVGLLEQHKTRYLTAILVIHVVAGTLAFTIDLKFPFSANQEVANFIKKQGIKDNFMVGSKDFAASSVAAMLNRKIYYPESDRLGSFILWKGRKNLKPPEVLDKTNQMITQENVNKAVLILNYPLKIKSPHFSTSKLFESSKAIAPGETYYLYIAEKTPIRLLQPRRSKVGETPTPQEL